jgi:hypothetical protein
MDDIIWRSWQTARRPDQSSAWATALVAFQPARGPATKGLLSTSGLHVERLVPDLASCVHSDCVVQECLHRPGECDHRADIFRSEIDLRVRSLLVAESYQYGCYGLDQRDRNVSLPVDTLDQCAVSRCARRQA